MTQESEARAFEIARELIAEHGPEVADFLQRKIDGLIASQDHETLLLWFTIRNAVGLTLQSSTTNH